VKILAIASVLRKSVLAVFLSMCAVSVSSADYFEKFSWEEINDGSGITWNPRAGLQAAKLKGDFYVMGGRAPVQFPKTFGESVFYNDVWHSSDQGDTWEILTDSFGAPWNARAYFQTVTMGKYMYVIGGQDSKVISNFLDPECDDILAGLPPITGSCPTSLLDSTFFGDVWRSKNGSDWQRMTDDAGWQPGLNGEKGRAGLMAVVHRGWIYVMGGSVNDDFAIIGPSGPPRQYFNDVYKSRNGRDWIQVTDAAEWPARAGGVLVSRGRQMYLLGGEDGFICEPGRPDRCPPYYNDVWKSTNGKNWKRVTENAGWSPRPGHQCEVLLGRIICFGGFGLPPQEPPPAPPNYDASNPMDIWASYNGKNWKELKGKASPPWNAAEPEDIKYDFAAFPVYFRNGKFRPAIYTFGGDRETFNPFDPDAINKVDSDAWRFSFERR